MTFKPVNLHAGKNDSTVKKGLLSMITIGLQGGTRFLSNWLIGRIAGKLILGLVASGTALAFTLNTFGLSSIQGAASKFIARARGQNDHTLIESTANHLAYRVCQLSMFLAMIAPLIWVFQFHGHTWEGLCISAILITTSASQFARGVHFGANQIARGTRYDLLTSIIGIVGTIFLLSLGVRNMLLTLPLSLTLGIYSLLCWPWSAKGTAPKEVRIEIDKFIVFSAIGSIASSGMLQISQLAAKGISLQAASQYAPALQLVTPFAMITTALTMVLYPSMSEAYGSNDHKRLQKQVDLATKAFLTVLVPIFGALAIASRPIILVIWGSNYHNAAQLMPIFCLALLVTNLAAPSIGLITSGPHKNMWYTLLFPQFGLATAIICWLTLIRYFGVFGVALGYGFGAFVTAISLMIVAAKLAKQPWFKIITLITLAMLFIGVLSWWCQSQSDSYLIDLVVAIGFAITWLGISARWLIFIIKNRKAA